MLRIACWDTRRLLQSTGATPVRGSGAQAKSVRPTGPTPPTEDIVATDGGRAANAAVRSPEDAAADDGARHAASPALRDLLAADRTRLANERTLLAYVRTAIGFVAAGGGLLYFFDVRSFEISGCLLLVAAALTLAIGVVRYRSIARDLTAFRSGLGLRGRGAGRKPG
jgi:putative membrane protein